ncbi:hypothetical protein GJ744_001248 [Endocarpon pusillum]|uniref:NACHT domain-containing protein n=1 Tax=Endocarpon pusillum TaxID=364733 RepID=A0A8H7E1Y9_9EURO|nr:hypothetical protein GJ744_001248 [Endocarpon pusillum]
MRLLEILANGDFRLTGKFLDNAIPRYAILSHKWEGDGQEVTFEDMVEGSGQGKAGYEKIKFCGEQAASDGLKYVWVDSCCIKKSSDAELSESINSMFRWYHRAQNCYVYLSDVCLSDVRTLMRKRGDDIRPNSWEQAFRNSQWFTRGWTLQELLAPRSVEFFSREGKRLGDKQSLEQHIHQITEIPISALRGSALSQFSTEQKLDWAKYRQTTYEEDWVYSLLGIFGISMPVIYGEGKANAFRRLKQEIDYASSKDKECLQHLRVTDPRHDKIRIEETKGGLIAESYHWILENYDFKRWRDDQQNFNHLLWIKGDPGKGKTMLLCGIIDELRKSTAETHLLSFFFCQETDPRINNAIAVLRGLLYLLINQQPSLVLHIQKYHELAGKTLFEDTNAWVAVSDIFTDVLQDPRLKSTYLIIDALDECKIGLPKLLDFIQKSSVFPHVKWLISSRNWPHIEERLDKVESKVRLCLELNAESVSVAVNTFIRYKVCQLAQEKNYNNKTRDAVLDYLLLNANDTFLWVALVCQNLENIPRGRTQARLGSFPPGLDSLYRRMMKQISESEDSELCKRILATIAIVYEPITLTELTSLVGMLEEESSDDLESLQEIISLCGSFLTVRKDTIYFVHQSAKDYLFASTEIFPSWKEQTHYEIFSRSLRVMSETLRRDIYSLHALGYPIEQVNQPNPDPLAASRYSCIYWVDHFCSWSTSSYAANHRISLQATDSVDVFLRKKYLCWLEALSLCRSMSKGLLSMAKLEALIQARADASALIELVHDARRFIMYHKQAIEISPLQVYASALLFSPAGSLIRRIYKEEEPKWIMIKGGIEDQWSICLQTLEGHSDSVTSVAFSHDSAQLASASYDGTVKVWDASSSECLQTLRCHSNWVHSVAFSHDSVRIASASDDSTIMVWDTSSGECLQTLEGHSGGVNSVAFSHDSAQLASASDDHTVKVWDVSSSKCLQTLKGHSGRVNSVAFSHDSAQLASASDDHTVKVWDVSSSKCLQTLKGHSDWVRSVAFSHNSAQLASASSDYTIIVWDTSSSKCLQTLKGHSHLVFSVAFSHDSARLASASYDHKVKVWDIISGECLQTLKGHSNCVISVAFSHDSARLASASRDHTIKVWDTSSSKCLPMLKDHSNMVNSVAFSHDSAWLASASSDYTVKVWDTSSGKCLQTLKGHSGKVTSIAFSHDWAWLASASEDSTVKVWDISSGKCLQTLRGHSDSVYAVAFSYDSAQLASASYKIVKVWDASSGECLQTLKGHSYYVFSVAFSYDSAQLASASGDVTVNIWDASNGKCLQTLKGHIDWVLAVAFSYDSARLASASFDNTVKVWDASSGECLQTLDIRSLFFNISFDTTDSYLHTGMGIIAINASSALDKTPHVTKSQGPRYQGWGLSSDRAWITYNSENLVRLPPEYRPSYSAVSGRTVGIGTGSGKVWMFSFNDEVC